MRQYAFVRSMLRPTAFIFLCGVAAALEELPDHCTAFAVGRKATKHGSTMVGQTTDAAGGPGTSLTFVSAQHHPRGSLRPVLDQETQGQIGTIPQVNDTYAYTWASYGVMNEHQLAFAESTCSARICADSRAHGGEALFSNQELSKVALERCKTARCALETMGKLASQFGFYGEDPGVEVCGETLVLADPQEAFVFHLMADPTGRSAIWAAQRVPDDQFAVVPNVFVIREMDLNSDDFMLSPNAMSAARELGWWDGTGPFNFAKTFSLGEYESPYYGARRIWRAYNLLAPSVKLDPFKQITPESAGYPFALKPDQLLTVEQIFRVYRDYLEGTPFSLVGNDLAAGPYNSPIRVAGGENEAKYSVGGWERPLSIYRNDFTVVSECRQERSGVVWIAPHSPHASVFAPVWSSSATAVPRSYVIDKNLSVDRQSLFGAALAVGNWAHGSQFSRAIVDIRAAQVPLEAEGHKLAADLAFHALEAHNDLIASHAERVHTAWWDLFWDLMGKYSDGYVVNRDAEGHPKPTQVGYPSWYLEGVHYEKGIKGASAADYAAQKRRMDMAAAQFKEIEAKRAPAPQEAQGASYTVLQM